MFPIPWNFPFRKKNGDVTTIGEMVGGGGGGSYTPDYENDRLIIGVHEDFNYFVPMSKEYVGSGLLGYEIKTIDNTGYTATIEVYKIYVDDGAIIATEKIKTIVYNSGETYDDDNITVRYSSKWIATLKTTMKNVSDDETVVSPVEWTYKTEVDYKWYMPE